MKLFYSPSSPFVRKVMICALALDLDGRIERVPTDPWSVPADLVQHNPLSKVPCLVTDDGLALFDSPVICEYLDHLGSGALFPPPGEARWVALRRQAAADGLLDAGVRWRREIMASGTDLTPEMARQRAYILRTVDAWEAEALPDALDIGTLSIACGLGYLDFRFGELDWRRGRPGLAAWFERMGQRREMAETAPPPPT